MALINEIAMLERCRWLPAAKTSQTFTDLGVQHGFFGKADEVPDRHYARQVHGTRLALAEMATTDGKATRRTEADAIYTLTPGTTISVRTADCLPVLFVDQARRAVMAIHAGWRGLSAGILGRSIDMMEEQGIKPADWHVVIGPAIAIESYEVGREVIEAMEIGGINLTPTQVGLATNKGKGDRWQLDTRVGGFFALTNAGIPPERIAVIQADTFRLEAWHSYRRDGKGAPSNWSWITL